MPYPFYKLKNKLTLIESNTLKEELTKLNNQYEEVFGKSNIDLNPIIEELTIKSTGGSKKKSKKRRNKRSMKGGSYDAIIGGGILLVFLYFCLFSEAEEDQYRGRVPDEYRNMEPYPSWYRQGNQQDPDDIYLPEFANPGNSYSHLATHPESYEARRYAARNGNDPRTDWNHLIDRIADEAGNDLDLMQRGVHGFEDSIRQRNYDLRPGGPTERAAGRFLEPIVMRGAQRDYDSFTRDGYRSQD